MISQERFVLYIWKYIKFSSQNYEGETHSMWGKISVKLPLLLFY